MVSLFFDGRRHIADWVADKEIEIVHELAQKVLEYEELLTTTSDICGELDRYVCVRASVHGRLSTDVGAVC